jgi:hypothetical protein
MYAVYGRIFGDFPAKKTKKTNFQFQFVRGSGDYFLSSRALREGPVGN